MTNSWIIAADNRIAALIEVGRNVGGTVTAITVGDVRVGNVDRVINVPLPDGVPPEALAPAVVAAVTLGDGDVVLAADRPVERVLAGAVAAAVFAPLLTGVKYIGDGQAELARFGGISREDIAFSSPVVVLIDGGATCEADAPTTETVAGGQPYDASLLSASRDDVAPVNLSAAKRIVAVGRGFKAQEDLSLASHLAGALNAEIGCSRPLAEGTGWLARDRYVGVSGQNVAPELYVAVGVSGQIQHTAGMRDSRVVVAINNDPGAPIFDEADYGVVGDLYTALPVLTDELK